MSTAAQALEHITPEPLREQMHIAVREISYARDIEPMIQASENLVPLLKALSGKFLLGIHTNRTGPIDYMLERLEMGGYFDPIMTVRYCEPKPSPDGAVKNFVQMGFGTPSGPFHGTVPWICKLRGLRKFLSFPTATTALSIMEHAVISLCLKRRYCLLSRNDPAFGREYFALQRIKNSVNEAKFNANNSC